MCASNLVLDFDSDGSHLSLVWVIPRLCRQLINETCEEEEEGEEEEGRQLSRDPAMDGARSRRMP